jgi:tetratricopeptide (TPR) repeat protein
MKAGRLDREAAAEGASIYEQSATWPIATRSGHAEPEAGTGTRRRPSASIPPAPNGTLPPPEMPASADEPTATDEEVANFLARALLAESGFEWARAAVHYEQAYALRPEAMSAARAARALHRADGDLDLAVRLAEEAVRLEPVNADFHVLLAIICRESGHVARAKSACERALAHDPAHARAKAIYAKLMSHR